MTAALHAHSTCSGCRPASLERQNTQNQPQNTPDDQCMSVLARSAAWAPNSKIRAAVSRCDGTFRAVGLSSLSPRFASCRPHRANNSSELQLLTKRWPNCGSSTRSCVGDGHSYSGAQNTEAEGWGGGGGRGVGQLLQIEAGLLHLGMWVLHGKAAECSIQLTNLLALALWRLVSV